MRKIKLNDLFLGSRGRTIYKVVYASRLTLKVVATKSYRGPEEWLIVKDGPEYPISPRKIEDYDLLPITAKDVGLKLWMQL